jgi:hypothetical protein
MYLLSRYTQKLCISWADLHQNTKHIYTKTIKFQSITSNETEKPAELRTFTISSLTPFSSSPSLSFSRIIMTFSVEFRCYIGVGTLAPLFFQNREKNIYKNSEQRRQRKD